MVPILKYISLIGLIYSINFTLHLKGIDDVVGEEGRVIDAVRHQWQVVGHGKLGYRIPFAQWERRPIDHDLGQEQHPHLVVIHPQHLSQRLALVHRSPGGLGEIR